MEPLTATATAIVGFVLTGVSTGALAKAGEILTDKGLEKAGKLLTLLTAKVPKLANAISRLKEKLLDVGEADLVHAEVVSVAGELAAAGEKDSEVAQAIFELAQEVNVNSNPQLTEEIQKLVNDLKSQSQAQNFNNFSKLADKGVFQGINNIENLNIS
ncbi:MAG: hypothetical protein ACFKPT_32680 [Gloeotrichia echinulata GP01]